MSRIMGTLTFTPRYSGVESLLLFHPSLRGAGEAALCTGDALVGPYVPIYAENRVDLKVRMNLTTFALLYDEKEGFTEAYQDLLVGMTAVMREEFELTVTAYWLDIRSIFIYIYIYTHT